MLDPSRLIESSGGLILSPCILTMVDRVGDDQSKDEIRTGRKTASGLGSKMKHGGRSALN